jgi:hypothetical protein
MPTALLRKYCRLALGSGAIFRDKMDAGMLKLEEAGDLWIFHAPIGCEFTEAPNAH